MRLQNAMKKGSARVSRALSNVSFDSRMATADDLFHLIARTAKCSTRDASNGDRDGRAPHFKLNSHNQKTFLPSTGKWFSQLSSLTKSQLKQMLQNKLAANKAPQTIGTTNQNG